MPAQRKYLFVSAPFSGIEVFFRNLVPRISSEEGVSADACYVDAREAQLNPQIPILRDNWTYICGMAARRNIRTLERAGNRYDAAIFNHLSVASLVGEFRRRTATVLSIDVTPTLLDGFSSWYKGSVRELSPAMRKLKTQLLDRPIYADARLILAWSELTKKSLCEEYGVQPERILVVPPGIDAELWKRKGDGRESNGRMNLLFVGADFERKGGDLVLKLAAMPEFTECTFDVVTREYIPGAPGNVRFHTGIRANSRELVDLYAASSLFLMPTRADFTPNVLCEAMAMGLPVVTTTVGGVPEMVTKETGVLLPSDDLDALAGAVARLIGDAELRERMARAGRDRVERVYDIRKTAATIHALLLRLTEGEKNPAFEMAYGK